MKLKDSDIKTRLAERPGWNREGDALEKTFTFNSFPDAIAYVTRLAFAAQEADHHPDIAISFKKVTVTWSTHSDGGITDKDFEGAKQSDMISSKIGAKT